MGVEEEREALADVIDVETPIDRLFHVLDAVGERKGDFLRGCRARLPDVVAADADRIEAG